MFTKGSNLLNMNNNHNRPRRFCWLPATVPLGLVALVTLAGSSVRAQAPLVSAVYTQTGGFFDYDFSVQNLGAFTLADVSITVPMGVGSVTNLSAPTGFLNLFDALSGLVDFLADADPGTPQDFFAGTTVSGFQFRSSTLLTASPFTALDEMGNATSGTIQVSAAPEPGTLHFFALAGALVAAVALTRRQRIATS